MKKYIVIVSILCAMHSLQAQVPGYMGKRVAVYGDISAAFAVGVVFKDDEWDDFNFHYGGGIDYTVTRSSSIGMRIDYIQDIEKSYNEVYFFGNIVSDRILCKTTTLGFLFNYKVALKKGVNISPVGNYFALEVGYLTTTYDMPTLSSLYPAPGNFGSFPILMGTTKRVVGKSRIFFDIGWRAGIAYSSGMLDDSPNINSAYFLGTKVLKTNVFANYLLNTRIAIGYIP